MLLILSSWQSIGVCLIYQSLDWCNWFQVCLPWSLSWLTLKFYCTSNFQFKSNFVEKASVYYYFTMNKQLTITRSHILEFGYETSLDLSITKPWILHNCEWVLRTVLFQSISFEILEFLGFPFFNKCAKLCPWMSSKYIQSFFQREHIIYAVYGILGD